MLYYYKTFWPISHCYQNSIFELTNLRVKPPKHLPDFLGRAAPARSPSRRLLETLSLSPLYHTHLFAPREVERDRQKRKLD